jgi:hypothetical protein
MSDKLDTIFDLLCDDFIKQLKDSTLNSADRKTLLEFLKDNNIKCNGQANTKIKSILDKLPFDENVTNGNVINL